jgi:large conductance mechanosensitive channel
MSKRRGVNRREVAQYQQVIGAASRRQYDYNSAMLQEFKKFALRGNVIDLAVGVIIGAAFAKITDSLVKDVLMPPLGMLTGRIDLTQLYWQIGGAERYPTVEAAREAGATVIAYGAFINAIVQFILLAFAVFLLVRFINNLQRQKDAEEVPATRACPFCTTAISDKATRCPHCTSELEPAATAG